VDPGTGPGTGITSAYLTPSSFPQATCRSRLRPRLKSLSGCRGLYFVYASCTASLTGCANDMEEFPYDRCAAILAASKWITNSMWCRWASGALRLASCQPSGDPAWILRHPVPPYDLIVGVS
jgi:hypothetical protein